MDELAGRTAVITGAASGLGRAMAERMAAEGMRLVLADIEAEPLADARRVRWPARGADVDRRAGRRVARRGHRAPRRRGVRALRRRPRAVQQRRRRQAGPGVGPHGRRLAVGARRRPVERDPRRAGVRAADAGRRPRAATSSTRRRCPGCCRSPTWPPTASPSRRVVALSEALQLDLDAEGADIGVSVLCPGFIATRITESERNRPAELDERGADPGRRAHDGRRGGDDGRRRGRRPRRRRDPRPIGSGS